MKKNHPISTINNSNPVLNQSAPYFPEDAFYTKALACIPIIGILIDRIVSESLDNQYKRGLNTQEALAHHKLNKTYNYCTIARNAITMAGATRIFQTLASTFLGNRNALILGTIVNVICLKGIFESYSIYQAIDLDIQFLEKSL